MQRVNPKIAAVITAVVLGVPVLGVAHTRHENSETEAKVRVDLIANQTALRLQDYLNSRLLSLSLMRQGLESGFINGVFRSEEMLVDALGTDLSDRFRVEIQDSGVPVYASEPTQAEGLRGLGSEVAHLQILDRKWELIIYPTPITLEALGQFHSLPFVLGGLGFVFVVAACVYFFLARREEHQNLLEQQRLVKERMAQTQKMEAVGQLAGGVAHDFNNLLTAISGSASLAGLEVQPNSASVCHLERIHQVCQRASEMTSRLLAFSRTQHMDRGHCEAGSELKALKGLLVPLMRNNIQLTYEVADDLHSLSLAPSELGQVVLNLVTNSMDAMPKGGRLTVRADSAAEDADGHEGRWLHLCVSDDGSGMSSDVRDRALEPFFTTKGPGEGTGLGLASAYGIVHRAEGTIQVESELGVGTQIHVYLPMGLSSAAPEPETTLTGKLSRESNILVVDDEDDVRAVSTAILESVGHEIVAVCNGKEALEFFAQKGKVDLVLTDTFMPEIGGLELARELRKGGFAGGIIITTGFANDLSMEDVRELQASFLAKPFSRTELLSLVEYCLAKGDSV